MSDLTLIPEAPETETAIAKARPRRGAISGALHELLTSFLPAALIVAVVNLFVAQPRTVDGRSMEPLLHENERLIVELVSHRVRAPERFQIIVINVGDRRDGPLIKRVIGLPGEVVEIRDGLVYVNEAPIEEPYLSEPILGAMPPRLVPEDHVFVLGDNRNASNDSRYFGMVPYEDIVGHAWIRYWPPSSIGLID